MRKVGAQVFGSPSEKKDPGSIPGEDKKYTSVIIFLHSLSVYKLTLSFHATTCQMNTLVSSYPSIPIPVSMRKLYKEKNSEPNSHSLVFNNTLFFALCVG